MLVATKNLITYMPRVFAMAAVILVAATTGCAGEFAGLVEGVTFEDDYTVRDRAPATRVTSDEKLIIIIAEEDGAQLRVTTVTVPDFVNAPLGQDVELGKENTGVPYMKASVGDLTEIDRSDGVRVLNSVNTRFSEALEGTVFLDEDDSGLFGSFSAQMEDGGHLDGSFLVERSQ